MSPSFEIRRAATRADFANDYCWVCRFDGDIIVEVRAHVDSMMVAYTILRNEGQRG